MSRLPAVLSAADLPLPELQAARLDGELFGLDAAFTPIDEIESPRLRAHAVHAGRSDRLIAEQHSAAWIWGATARPPLPHRLCVALGARVRHSTREPVREVVIDPGEIASFDGLLVTAPLRTVLDLARFSPVFGQEEQSIVAWLLAHHRFTLADVLDDLDQRRNLPNKRLAVSRLTPLG